MDAKLLNKISNKDLLRSHIQHFAEDLGMGRPTTCSEELMLVITDWQATMPAEIMDVLVHFLETRTDDPSQLKLTHLDLHGRLPRILEALLSNRKFFESPASSVETLEVSLEQIDPHSDSVPLFPNLRALRMYRPEFPGCTEDVAHVGVRLLKLNAERLRDVAVVALQQDDAVFNTTISRLPGDVVVVSQLWCAAQCQE